MSKISRRDIFTRFTTKVSSVLGHAWIFVLALIVLLLWGLSGLLLGFSDTWQLIINTGTTIVTFLMVFIIQNTQNRDNLAMNIKLDAILKRLGVSSEELFAAEDDSDKSLEEKKAEMQGLMISPKREATTSRRGGRSPAHDRQMPA
jgi:low affinity Fe/Cu permease